MTKYQVEIKEVHTRIINVEAESEQDAQVKAEEVLDCGVNQDGTDLDESAEYDYTLERDEWNVWKVA